MDFLHVWPVTKTENDFLCKLSTMSIQLQYNLLSDHCNSQQQVRQVPAVFKYHNLQNPKTLIRIYLHLKEIPLLRKDLKTIS